jgi:hypothetical protein
MRMSPGRRRAASTPLPTLALLVAGTLALAACDRGEPATAGGPPLARRLTESQYRNVIADVFGDDIKIGGRFEPGNRKNGLLAVGTSVVAVSPAGFEQYDAMARTIAAQALDEQHRARTVPCQPAKTTEADDACASQFLAGVGHRLFRRPLTETELSRQVAIADEAAKTLGDFYAGLEYGLAGLLEAPEFLFRSDSTEPDPAHPGQQRLTGAAKASRLSFLLWDSTPDDALLAAAEAGDLHSKEGLAKQVDRMLASPRLEDGVRAFFTDFLAFDKFEELAKDPQIYPAFGPKVARDAREQTLHTLTDLLVTKQGDYRDIFTAKQTFMTRALGVVYQVPVPKKDGWMPYEFAADDPRGGILTQISFNLLYSHPGRSSATLRGKAVRELLLCQPVPMPPANVSFNVVQDTNNPLYKTARERLTAHSTEPTCAGCHKITDPIGLALENFDGAGMYRSEENGAKIDASGDIDGTHYKDAAELGRALHDHPGTTACVADSLYRYASGRDYVAGEESWRDWLQKRFAGDGYKVPALLRRIATSDAFFAVAPAPAAAPKPATTAAADPTSTDQHPGTRAGANPLREAGL